MRPSVQQTTTQTPREGGHRDPAGSEWVTAWQAVGLVAQAEVVSSPPHLPPALAVLHKATYLGRWKDQALAWELPLGSITCHRSARRQWCGM